MNTHYTYESHASQHMFRLTNSAGEYSGVMYQSEIEPNHWCMSRGVGIIDIQPLRETIVEKHDIKIITQCLHDTCPECKGTGLKKNGSVCVHMISCPCSKCTPFC